MCCCFQYSACIFFFSWQNQKKNSFFKHDECQILGRLQDRCQDQAIHCLVLICFTTKLHECHYKERFIAESVKCSSIPGGQTRDLLLEQRLNFHISTFYTAIPNALLQSRLKDPIHSNLLKKIEKGRHKFTAITAILSL